MDEFRSGDNAADLALEMVGYNKDVLGVGGATGSLTKRLVEEQGCAVVAIERDRADAQAVQRWAEPVIVGDIDDLSLWSEAKDESFDAVLLCDTLAAARDPAAVLSRAVRKLRPSGVVVAWLPNMAHGDTRLALMHGKFRHGDHGLLDSPHVRFFTREVVLELFRHAGLVVVDSARVIVPLFSARGGPSVDEVPPDVLDELLEDPDVETSQFVLRAVRDSGDRALVELARRAEELSDRARRESVRTALLRSELWQMEQLRGELRSLRQLLEQRQAEIEVQKAHIEEQGDIVAEQHRYIDALQGHITGLEQNAEALQRSLEDLHGRFVAVDAAYQAVLGMRTVQATAPIRWVYNKLTGKATGNKKGTT